MEQPLEPSDHQLLAYLDGVCARLRRVCATGFVHDSEKTEGQLHVDASFVEDSVGAVIADLEKTPPRKTSLNDSVNTACREFLMSTLTPYSIKTTTDSDLPELWLSPELLLAILRRALEITAKSAGPECELRITTSRLGDEAIVSVETSVSDESSTQPIHLRTLTLADIVQELGGDIQVERNSTLARLTLAFGTNARIQ